jgi:hypothetical protein
MKFDEITVNDFYFTHSGAYHDSGNNRAQRSTTDDYGTAITYSLLSLLTDFRNKYLPRISVSHYLDAPSIR